jgi:thioredoxin 2
MAEPQLVRCQHCGAMNRVATEKMGRGRAAVCGKCKSPLTSGGGEPMTVTDGTFAEMVERSALPVLLDMWAPWCGPCRMVGPAVDEIARELAGRLRVGKMNVDENPVTSERFAIQSIPALLIFRDGREVDRIVGALPKSEILRRLERLVG